MELLYMQELAGMSTEKEAIRPSANVESKVASNKLKIDAIKSRRNSSVAANVEPASILFHKLQFIKTQEYERVPVLFTRRVIC